MNSTHDGTAGDLLAQIAAAPPGAQLHFVERDLGQRDFEDLHSAMRLGLAIITRLGKKFHEDKLARIVAVRLNPPKAAAAVN